MEQDSNIFSPPSSVTTIELQESIEQPCSNSMSYLTLSLVFLPEVSKTDPHTSHWQRCLETRLWSPSKSWSLTSFDHKMWLKAYTLDDEWTLSQIVLFLAIFWVEVQCSLSSWLSVLFWLVRAVINMCKQMQKNTKIHHRGRVEEACRIGWHILKPQITHFTQCLGENVDSTDLSGFNMVML